MRAVRRPSQTASAANSQGDPFGSRPKPYDDGIPGGSRRENRWIQAERGGAPDALVAGGLAVAAAAVFGSLFAHWYRLKAGGLVIFGALDRLPETRTGWQLFALTDVVLAAVAAGALVLAVALAGGARPGPRWLAAAVAAVAGALVATALRAANPPPSARLGPLELAPAVGAYLAIAGLASMLVALLLVLLWR